MTVDSSARAGHGHLLKILGVTFGIAVAVGNSIGSGILRSPSIIAGEAPAGWVMLLLWTLGGVQALVAANISAELATAMPRSGGYYLYAQRAFGDVGGLIVGWTIWLSKLAGIASTSISFAEFLPLLVPAAGDHKIAVALALQASLYAANILGLREGRALQETTSLIKAGMLLVFILVAVLLYVPAEPKTVLSSPLVWTWANVVLAFQLIRGAYSGWDAPVYFTGENHSPHTSIPRSLLYGVLLISVIYIGVNAALIHALGVEGMRGSPLPFTTVLAQFGRGIPSALFALTAMITVASCCNANVMSAPRVIMALGVDGLLPRMFANVNRGGSPGNAFLLTAIGSLGLALSGTFALVFGLIATLDSASGAIVDAAFFRLRWREPDLPRPYRAIGYPVVPAIPLVMDVALLILFARADYVGGAVALGLGLLCIPFAWVARRGRKAASNPAA
jgi:APA family basic amino acid/polyamine antiporter